jgi:hypothetical protein
MTFIITTIISHTQASPLHVCVRVYIHPHALLIIN